MLFLHELLLFKSDFVELIQLILDLLVLKSLVFELSGLILSFVCCSHCYLLHVFFHKAFGIFTWGFVGEKCSLASVDFASQEFLKSDVRQVFVILQFFISFAVLLRDGGWGAEDVVSGRELTVDFILVYVDLAFVESKTERSSTWLVSFAFIPLFHGAILTSVTRYFPTDVRKGCHHRSLSTHLWEPSLADFHRRVQTWWASDVLRSCWSHGRASVHGHRALFWRAIVTSCSWSSVSCIHSCITWKNWIILVAWLGIILELKTAIWVYNDMSYSHVEFAEFSSSSSPDKVGEDRL